MAGNKFIIEIRTKGFKGAKEDLKDVKDQVEGYSRGGKKFRGTTAGMRRSLGALRNNLLLVSFAFSGVALAAKKFLDTAGQFETARARLQAMTGSAEEAARVFNILNETAAKTPLTLDDIIEAGVSLEAFGASAEAAIIPITDLAGRMGTTATEAAQAFGRAFAGGAGAADIFRERGILQVIKDFKGIEKLTDLTLPEFRVALVETMIAPSAGIAGASKLIAETWVGAVSNMQDAFTRLSARIGETLMPTARGLVAAITRITNSIDTEEIKAYGTAFGVVVAGGLLAAAAAMIKAKREAQKLSIALVRTGWGAIIIAIGFAIGALIDLSNHFESTTKEVDNNKKSVESWLEELKNATVTNEELAESIAESEAALKKKMGILQATNSEGKYAAEVGRDLTAVEKEYLEVIDQLVEKKKQEKEAQKHLNEVREISKDLIKDLEQLKMKDRGATEKQIAIAQYLQNAQDQLNKIAGETGSVFLELQETTQGLSVGFSTFTDKSSFTTEQLEAMSLTVQAVAFSIKQLEQGMKDAAEEAIFADSIEFQIDKIQEKADKYLELTGQEVAVAEWAEQAKTDIIIDHLERRNILYQSAMAGYDTFINSLIDMEITGKERREKVWGAMKASFISMLGELIKESIKNFIAQQVIAQTAETTAIASAQVTGRAIALAYAAAAANVSLSTLGGAAAPAAVALTATHALSKTLSIATAESGGLIDGRRHSQGGVIIEAEGGEFIMKREAVKNIGIQNLEAMNQTGSGSSITVNISAPLVDETVVDSIIPAIEKAKRMNLA